MIPQINISNFSYELPEDRIAKFPLERRDASKLLKFEGGQITDNRFSDLPSLLPTDAMMVFNETKVVPARLHFHRASGARIEIFCLEPDSPADYVSSFASRGSCRWKCIVGNVKRWKPGEALFLTNPEDDARVAALNLTAHMVERQGETSIIELCWDADMEFSEVLDVCGNIPIPPYLNRDTQDIDLERYQTTYALQRGSVAAPTAGLHFTPEVMNEIAARGISIYKVCLHVGAGTFLPVKSEQISGHAMHREPFIVQKSFIKALMEHKAAGKPVVAVGTTSVRTLESLYWAGVQCFRTEELRDVAQWDPYEDVTPESLPTTCEALQALISYLDKYNMNELSLGTRIIIVPGYKLRIVNILVTNFHQPQSTLLLLISAFVGDNWQKIYAHAMQGAYRFLSYGDSSLLFSIQ